MKSNLFESYRKCLEKCLKTYTKRLKINLEQTIGNQSNNSSQNGIALEKKCLRKLMKLTVTFWITTINETKKQVREIQSKLKSTQTNPEYKATHKQIIINEEQVIQQLRRKKLESVKTQEIKMIMLT